MTLGRDSAGTFFVRRCTTTQRSWRPRRTHDLYLPSVAMISSYLTYAVFFSSSGLPIAVIIVESFNITPERIVSVLRVFLYLRRCNRLVYRVSVSSTAQPIQERRARF
jgi:hypothetical protein